MFRGKDISGEVSTNGKERCAIAHGAQPKSSELIFESSVSIWEGILVVENAEATATVGGTETGQRHNKRWSTLRRLK